MPKGRRRSGWWRSLEPFDQLVIVCAILAVPVVIAYCLLSAALFVLVFVEGILRG